MNAATLAGIRQIAATMNQPTESYTARDFELNVEYRGSKDGLTAYAYNGSVWGWVAGIERWVRVR